MSNLAERVAGVSQVRCRRERHETPEDRLYRETGIRREHCLSPSHDAVKIGEMLDGRVVLKNLSEHEVEDAAQMLP